MFTISVGVFSQTTSGALCNTSLHAGILEWGAVSAR